jgi:hypothetical protein
MDNAECGSVGADAKRKRYAGGGKKPGTSDQPPKGMFQVVHACS